MCVVLRDNNCDGVNKKEQESNGPSGGPLPHKHHPAEP
jgi:hypothetical protein